jgi:hypothetical protein
MEVIMAKIFPMYDYIDQKVERLISSNVDMPDQLPFRGAISDDLIRIPQQKI